MKKDSGFDGPLSRREFFGGVGVTAGALAALGTTATLPTTANAASKPRPALSAYGIALELDGRHAGFAIEATLDGALTDLVYAPGARSATIRSAGEPPVVRLRFGTHASRDFMRWVDTQVAADALSIVLVDLVSRRELHRFDMRGAFASELKMTKLDAATADSVTFEATVRMMEGRHKFDPGRLLAATTKLSAPSPNSFKIWVQGLEKSTPRILAIDGVGRFLASQATTGRDAVRDTRTTGPENQPLKIVVTRDAALPFVDWLDSTMTSDRATRQGKIELFDRLGQLVGSVDLIDLLPRRANFPFPSDTSTHVAEIELACRQLRFNLDGFFS